MPKTGLSTGATTHSHGFRQIVVLLITLVIVPTAALLAVGILMLVFWEARLNLLFGILVVTLVVCLVIGTVLALVLLRREATLSTLQLDFVSKVSHELRTPLTSISMFSEMLEENLGTDPREAELCLDVLRRETHRLSNSIERLLDWGRMEAGRRTYNTQREDVASLVRDAAQAVMPSLTGEDHRLEVEIDSELPALNVDRGALTDALVNLLANAVKYTGDTKRIALRATADAHWVRLSVTDNGPGIPRREHRRIFQKFYRADERLSREVEGSGLGLAIVGHVVHGHRGRIEVESELGHGSTFTILLPSPRSLKARSTARGGGPGVPA